MATTKYPLKKHLFLITLALIVLFAAFSVTAPVSASGSTLTVDLSGTWLGSVAVQLWTSDGGTLLWSTSNQHGGVRTYAVTPGTYDIKLVQGPNVYVVNDLDCHTDCNAGDFTADLTVDLEGTWLASVAVQLFVDNGGMIWSASNQHGGVRHYNVLKSNYDLKLVQGSHFLLIDIDCNTDCAAGDFTADLMVDLDGTWLASVAVQLFVDNGDMIWSASNQHGGERHYNVLKSTYDLKLVQGSHSLAIGDINCTGETCAAGDFTADLTVDLNGTWLASVAVQLFMDDGGMIWSASNQHGGERHYNVLKGTYDLKLVQGPQIFDMANVNCTGDTCAAANPNQILTVDLSGTWLASVAVQLYVDGGGLIWSASNQHGGVRTYNVLPDTYDLKLVQGPMILDVADVNCEGGDCNAGDVITNLNVDLNGTWLASVAVQLFVDDGGMIWSASNQHGGLRSYNVLPGSYDLKLVQGAKTLDVANVNCTGEECDAGDFVANLALELSGTWPASIAAALHLNDAIPNSTGAIIWSASNQHGALRNYNVLKSFYDVRLSMGANAYIWDAVDCTGETCTLDKSALTVDFPGISSVHVYLYNSDNGAGTVSGSVIASQLYKNNQAIFTNLTNGKYDLRLVKGAKTLIVDNVIVLGNFANAGTLVSTLTVNFPGINTVHTYVKVDDGTTGTTTGGDVDSSLYKTDGTAIVVLKGLYDVRLTKGASLYIQDAVNCNTDCVVTDIVSTLTVNFPGVSSVHTYVKVDDGTAGTAVGGDVDSSLYKADNTFIVVLKGLYDVRITKGASAYLRDAVDCTTDCVVTDIVSTLTVNFPGLSTVHTYVKVDDGNMGTASGGDVDSSLYKTDGTSIVVLQGTYDIRVAKGAQVNLYDAVDCTSGGPCLVDNIVKTLTINFPGISSVHAYVKVDDNIVNSASGGDVDSSLYKSHSTTIVVLNGLYDVRVAKGAQVNIYDAVDCTDSGSCLVDNIVATLTIKFPGMSSIHNYIKVPDGLNNSATGGDVDSRLYQNNETVLVVLKGYYDVRIVKGSDAFIYDNVDCTGNTCTLDKSTLTVKFPGIASVHTYVYASNNVPGTVSGSPVGSQTYKTDQAVFANLVNGVYDVKVVKGAEVKIIDNVTVLGNWATVDNIVATLTVNFPGIASVHTYVKVNNGVVGTATGGDVDNRTYKTDQATLVVLRDVYDLKVVKGAEVKIIDAVNCNAAACTVDNIVATLTINFPGIASVHSYVKVNDGVGGTAVGGDVDNRTYKTDMTELVVLRSTYDVKIVKGAEVKIIDAVDCTGATCTIDNIVATLTINFPGIASVHSYVKVNDGASGTANGGDVDNRTYKTDQAQLVVLRSTYDVKIVKGAEIKIIDAVDCTNATCTVENIVAILTINFPGITSVHSYVKVNDGVGGTATGGDVDNRTYKTDMAELVVLRSTYDVKIVKGAEVKIIDAVDCTSATCTVDDIVATLTINFPGITSVHSYVKVNDGVGGTATGGDVDNRTYKTDQAQLVVLRSTYDVKIVKGAEVKIIDAVDCTGATCSVDNIVATLTINFPGIASVHSYVKVNDGVGGTASGGDVDNRTYKTDMAELVVLRGTYDLKVVKGAEVKIIDAVDCTGATCTVDDIVATLAINFPGIPSVHSYVKINDGVGGTATGGDVDNRTYKTDQAELVVLRSTYDVKVVKGAEVKIIDAVDCTSATCTVENIVATLTINFPGVASVHSYVPKFCANRGTSHKKMTMTAFPAKM